MKQVFAVFSNLLVLCLFPAPGKFFAQTNLLFYATLSASETVPAVASPDGKAMISLLFSPDRTQMQVSGLILGLEGPMTAANLHIGNPGEIGDAVVFLNPIISGRRVGGNLPVPPGLLEKLLLGEAYININTTARPTGEIRGQLRGEVDVNFRSLLDGPSMVPAVGTPAVGLGGLHLATGSKDLDVAFFTRGLSGPITGAALHEGEAGAVGAKLTDLKNNGFFVGDLIDLDLLPGDFFEKCRAGRIYVVVKTDAHPEGEIRGQLAFLGYLNALSPLFAGQGVPPTGSTAYGFAYAYPNESLDSLVIMALTDIQTQSTFEVRAAPAGMNGASVANLGLLNSPGLFGGQISLSEADLTKFMANGLYLNAPSPAFPNGEIRGQLRTCLRKCYAFDLCGNQEVPPNPAPALGMAFASVDVVNCYIHGLCITDGLSGPVAEAHIHQAVPGANGGVLHPLAASTYFEIENEIAPGEGVRIEAGDTYINMHTAAFPAGEIRGQIRRGLTCPLVSGVSENAGIQNLEVFPNPVGERLVVRFSSRESFEGRFWLRDVSGRAVLEKVVSASPGVSVFQLETGALGAGTYFLGLERADRPGGVFLHKVVKME